MCQVYMLVQNALRINDLYAKNVKALMWAHCHFHENPFCSKYGYRSHHLRAALSNMEAISHMKLVKFNEKLKFSSSCQPYFKCYRAAYGKWLTLDNTDMEYFHQCRNFTGQRWSRIPKSLCNTVSATNAVNRTISSNPNALIYFFFCREMQNSLNKNLKSLNGMRTCLSLIPN